MHKEASMPSLREAYHLALRAPTCKCYSALQSPDCFNFQSMNCGINVHLYSLRTLPTGNGKKLSCSQAQLGQATGFAVA